MKNKPPLKVIDLLPEDGYAVACKDCGVKYYHFSVIDELKETIIALENDIKNPNYKKGI